MHSNATNSEAQLLMSDFGRLNESLWFSNGYNIKLLNKFKKLIDKN